MCLDYEIIFCVVVVDQPVVLTNRYIERAWVTLVYLYISYKHTYMHT